ncbi:hypothetical protein GCM10010470_16520 [Saccharopolyspora taberi]|uniref:Uncharacterized protein n=1 Tax=Saccharopolyspora taberi TaxID=60895 RepID=A0ABN3V885_9PSEU
MPYNQTVKRLRIDDQEITDINVIVNALATAKHRKQYPGAESCIAIELAAVQHLLSLIADRVVSATEARDVVNRLAERLHEDNDDLRVMKEMEAGGLF